MKYQPLIRDSADIILEISDETLSLSSQEDPESRSTTLVPVLVFGLAFAECNYMTCTC